MSTVHFIPIDSPFGGWGENVNKNTQFQIPFTKHFTIYLKHLIVYYLISNNLISTT